MKAKLCGAAGTATLLCLAGAALAQQPATSDYKLEPGTQLVYETSASLSADILPGAGEQARFEVRYTVLAQGAEGTTIFAAIDPRQEETTGTAEEPELGGRFTFQITPEGELGQRTAGLAKSPVMGWSPMNNFPPVPGEDQTTVTWPLPMMGAELPVTAERKADNGNVNVTLKLDKSAMAGEGGETPQANFTGQFVYVPEEKSTGSSRYTLEAQSRGPDGRPLTITMDSESSRTAKKKLSADELQKLQKDVQAGIKALESVTQLMQQEDPETSKALEAFQSYLNEYPEGEFSRAFQNDIKALRKMGELVQNAQALKEGNKAPDFTAKTLSGENLKLSELQGKVVLLDFWASWCGPCIAEMPNLKDLYQQYKDKGFTIVGISADRTEEALKEFLSKNEYTWPMIYQAPDSEGTILEQYGIQKFPTTLLLDREGTIKAVDLRGKALADAVKDLVDEKK